MLTPCEKRIIHELQERMRVIGMRKSHGDFSRFVVWAIDGHLAIAERPLRYHPDFGGSGKPLPPEARKAAVDWVSKLEAVGVRSIICLTHPSELRYYEPLGLHPEGLLGFLKSRGFQVAHIPWPDPAHSKSLEERKKRLEKVNEIKLKAFEAYKFLDEPVVVICSAAIDRSPPVAAYIACRVEDKIRNVF